MNNKFLILIWTWMNIWCSNSSSLSLSLQCVQSTRPFCFVIEHTPTHRKNSACSSINLEQSLLWTPIYTYDTFSRWCGLSPRCFCNPFIPLFLTWFPFLRVFVFVLFLFFFFCARHPYTDNGCYCTCKRKELIFRGVFCYHLHTCEHPHIHTHASPSFFLFILHCSEDENSHTIQTYTYIYALEILEHIDEDFW